MELNVRVNSSLAIGVAAGAIIGAAMTGHCTKYCSSLASALCPHNWPKLLAGSTQKEAKNCPSAGSQKAACCPFSGMTTAQVSKSENETKGDEERAEEREAFWYNEGVTEYFRVELAMRGILFDSRSEFQRVQVIETEQFGRTLVMDGQTQSARADEHIYHESLVHPSMLLHPKPKSVFIGGGGEFATAREVLRHNSVERVVMVDIDKVACDICRQELPEWNNGAYDDPRFHIEYMDAKLWLEQNDEKFDVIIMDICDPIEAGPGYKLYTREFYAFLRERLTEGGLFVTQSGPCAVFNAKEECFTVIHKTLSSSFDVVVPYFVDIPSFGSNWGFNLAFNLKSADEDRSSALKLVLNSSIEEFDEKIEKRIRGGNAGMKYLDGLTWRGMLGVPKEVRQQCIDEDRLMTIDNPVFMFSS